MATSHDDSNKSKSPRTPEPPDKAMGTAEKMDRTADAVAKGSPGKHDKPTDDPEVRGAAKLHGKEPSVEDQQKDADKARTKLEDEARKTASQPKVAVDHGGAGKTDTSIPSKDDPDEDPNHERDPGETPPLTDEEIEAGEQTLRDAHAANPKGFLVSDTQAWDQAVGAVSEGTPLNQRGDQNAMPTVPENYDRVLRSGSVRSDVPVKGHGQKAVHDRENETTSN